MNAREQIITTTDLFVPVPETVLPSGIVVPAHRTSRYLCTTDSAGCIVLGPNYTPRNNINFAEANQACERSGYKLERETRALALAYQISAQDENWTGGKVGKGKLYQGLRKWSVNGPQPANFEPKDADERLWFVLPGGERIYDVAGNLWRWVFDDVHGNSNGLIAKPFKKDSTSLVIPYPTEEKGQGWTPSVGANWSGRALVRGGCWGSESYAGVFNLDLVWPGLRFDHVGFRCTN